MGPLFSLSILSKFTNSTTSTLTGWVTMCRTICCAVVLSALSWQVPSGAAESAKAKDINPPDWTQLQWQIIQSLTLDRLPPLPDSPSNRVANNPGAVAFGRALFFDDTLVGDGMVSCASCHQPDRYFTDGKARAGGANELKGRNTPTIVGSAHQAWFYWDGRRDSLWSQALIPFEAPDEMGGDRVGVLLRIAANPALAKQYQAIFREPLFVPQSGKALEQGAGPLAAEPARSNWYQLPARSKKRINRSYANIGKAIAAYMRTVQPTSNRFDQYVGALQAGDTGRARDLISASEKSGLSLFIDDGKTQCMRCHSGPRFTNDNFQNIGTGNFDGAHLDFGRILGMQSVITDEFNCLGAYSDARPEQCTGLRFMSRDPHQPLTGAFKTPSLRNVAATAPYFHDGSKQSLRDVIEHYRNPPTTGKAGQHELQALQLSNDDVTALVDFLTMLSEPKSTSPR